MGIYDGIKSGCQDEDGVNDCYNLCTNNGRYCATDPDNDLDRGISGADVVRESLRRICIWKMHGADDGVGAPWWDYVDEFLFRCQTEEYFMSKQCANDAMKHAKVDQKKVDACMAKSGGMEEDVENSLLAKQLYEKDKSGVVILPAMYVNRVSIRGSLEFPTVFKAICAGYSTGTTPSVCTTCSNCNDQKDCLAKGACSENVNGGVSQMRMVAAMGGLALAFAGLSFVQHRRYQSQMQAQVKGIIAEYMPLESDKAQNTAVSDEDGEFT